MTLVIPNTDPIDLVIVKKMAPGRWAAEVFINALGDEPGRSFGDSAQTAFDGACASLSLRLRAQAGGLSASANQAENQAAAVLTLRGSRHAARLLAARAEADSAAQQAAIDAGVPPTVTCDAAPEVTPQAAPEVVTGLVPDAAPASEPAAVAAEPNDGGDPGKE